jgi:hypothetical protein
MSWTPGAHACSRYLYFLIIVEGKLERAPTLVQPLHFTGLDAVVEALEKLQSYAPEAHTP